MILVTTTARSARKASRLLVKRGVPVRALAHHPAQVAALVEAGVDVVEGDLDVPESIDVAMQAVSSVVLVSLRFCSGAQRIETPCREDLELLEPTRRKHHQQSLVGLAIARRRARPRSRTC